MKKYSFWFALCVAFSFQTTFVGGGGTGVDEECFDRDLTDAAFAYLEAQRDVDAADFFARYSAKREAALLAALSQRKQLYTDSMLVTADAARRNLEEARRNFVNAVFFLQATCENRRRAQSFEELLNQVGPAVQQSKKHRNAFRQQQVQLVDVGIGVTVELRDPADVDGQDEDSSRQAKKVKKQKKQDKYGKKSKKKKEKHRRKKKQGGSGTDGDCQPSEPIRVVPGGSRNSVGWLGSLAQSFHQQVGMMRECVPFLREDKAKHE